MHFTDDKLKFVQWFSIWKEPMKPAVLICSLGQLRQCHCWARGLSQAIWLFVELEFHCSCYLILAPYSLVGLRQEELIQALLSQQTYFSGFNITFGGWNVVITSTRRLFHSYTTLSLMKKWTKDTAEQRSENMLASCTADDKETERELGTVILKMNAGLEHQLNSCTMAW